MPKQSDSSVRPIDIIVAGHICLDVIPKIPKTGIKQIEKLFIPGKLINVEEPAVSTGGPVSNTGLALHRLGAKTKLMSKLGSDAFGKMILDLLNKENVSTDGMSIVKNEFSSYTIAIVPPGIDRIFLHSPGTNNTFGYVDLNFTLIKQAKLFHLGYPPLMHKLYLNDGEELVKIYRKVKQCGTTTSLDVSLPDPNSESGKVNWDKILKRVLPYVDIFFPSIEEAAFMVERDWFTRLRQKNPGTDLVTVFTGADFSRISGKLLKYGTKIVSLKAGVRGFYLRTTDKKRLSQIGYLKPDNIDNWTNRELWHPSFYVPEIASATGSGDSSIAGFLISYLHGNTIESTLDYACMVGAQNVRVLDAVSGIKSWKETTEQVTRKPKVNYFPVTTSGWRYDKTYQIWYGPNDKKIA